MDNERTGIVASSPDESSQQLSERTAPPVLRCRMSKVMTNTAYRKSRGTDKPFSGSEERAKAIWNELIRKEKWKSTKAAPTAAPASQG